MFWSETIKLSRPNGAMNQGRPAAGRKGGQEDGMIRALDR
jgi:hypothetical protein